VKPFDTLAPGAGSSAAIRAPKTLQAFEMLPQGMAPRAGVSSAAAGRQGHEIPPNARLASQGLMITQKVPKTYEFMPDASAAAQGLNSAKCGCAGSSGPCGSPASGAMLRGGGTQVGANPWSIAAALPSSLVHLKKVASMAPDTKFHNGGAPIGTPRRSIFLPTFLARIPDFGGASDVPCADFRRRCNQLQQEVDDTEGRYGKRITNSASRFRESERRLAACHLPDWWPTDCDSLQRERAALGPLRRSISDRIATNTDPLEFMRLQAEQARVEGIAEELQRLYDYCIRGSRGERSEFTEQGRTAECEARYIERRQSRDIYLTVLDELKVEIDRILARWSILINSEEYADCEPCNLNYPEVG